MKKEKLLTILGPTAVGNTELSVYLAKILGSSIISGDAFQVYRGMDIGTAKVTKEEADGIFHYLVDCMEPAESYSAAIFQEKAREYISKENKKDKIPILIGGTGLYVQGLLEGYVFSPKVEGRSKWYTFYKMQGKEGLADAFKKLLPEEVIPLDPQRMVRRLELADAGQSLVTDRAEHLVYDGPVIGITMDRSVLYDRINKRVHQMIERGLKEEVAALLTAGVPENSQAFKGIGYKEMLPVLHGKYSLEEAEALIAKNTRHFAKRQLTWYRRMPYIHWVERTDTDTWLREIEAYVISWIRGESEWKGK